MEGGNPKESHGIKMKAKPENVKLFSCECQ